MLQFNLERALYEALATSTPENLAELRTLHDEALPIFEEARDDWALCVAYGAAVLLEDFDGRSKAAMAAAAERVTELARRVGYSLYVDWGLAAAMSARCSLRMAMRAA